MFEDIKGIITSLKSKNTLQWPKEKKRKEQTLIYKTLRRKLMMEQQQHKTKQSKAKTNKQTNKQTKSHAHTTHNA